MRTELTWTHYRLLLSVENEKARKFYLNDAAEANWSTRQLERQIHSFYYERLLSSKDKKPVVDEAERNASPAKSEDLIKDPYVLEFLNINENKRMFASRYKLYLPTEEELARELQHEIELIRAEKSLH